jgi:hypothetical protein
MDSSALCGVLCFDNFCSPTADDSRVSPTSHECRSSAVVYRWTFRSDGAAHIILGNSSTFDQLHTASIATSYNKVWYALEFHFRPRVFLFSLMLCISCTIVCVVDLWWSNKRIQRILPLHFVTDRSDLQNNMAGHNCLRLPLP